MKKRRVKFVNKLKKRAKQLKSETQVLILAYADKRTPLTAKILIAVTVGYLLSPIDLVPDFIPIIGLLDDLIVVPFLIALSIKLIPAPVLAKARQSVNNNPKRLIKNRWMFALVIVIIWLTLLYWSYQYFRFLWE